MKWLNIGGGHHITRDDYDIDLLKKIVNHFQDKYGVTVYLEPGEAVVLNAGYLFTTVLDIVHNGMDIAILDTSAACHMPDVLEMPVIKAFRNFAFNFLNAFFHFQKKEGGSGNERTEQVSVSDRTEWHQHGFRPDAASGVGSQNPLPKVVSPRL